LNLLNTPSLSDSFSDLENRWFEMSALADSDVFIEDNSKISDNAGIRPGKWITVNRKFIREYTDLGFTKLILGGGTQDTSSLCDFDSNSALVNQIGDFINNMSLGALPKVGTTVFIKYRIGGGKDSNLGVNVITSIDDVDFVLTGPNSSINTQVNQSLIVTNITPAIGGADQPSIDEIRNMIAYNFAAQNRAVTLNDYKSLIETMPSTYGAPAKVNVMEEDNKVKIKLLSYDENGNLSDTVSTTLKNNILNYLSEYRMINDYVDIESGQVIDMGLEIDLVIDKNGNQTEIITNSIEDIVDYFAIEKRKMGDPLLVGDLNRLIGQVNGVVNVVDVRVFNLTGGEYSSAEVAQSYSDPATKEILQSDMTIYMKSNQIFQIRFPNKDIKIRVKTLGSTTF
jgi:hypothetical protein